MIRTAVACAAVLVSVGACSGVTPGASTDSGSDKTATFATVAGFDDTLSVTGLWQVLLEEKGYTIKTTGLELAASYAGVARGDIDGYLNSWLPVSHASFVDKYKDKIDITKPYYEDNRLLLAVPEYAEENTISELVQNADKYGNQIVGIEAGSGLMKLLPDVLAKYNGTDKLKIVEGSTPASNAAMKGATENKELIVTASWKPNWAFAAMPIKALEDDLNAWPKPDTSVMVLSKKFTEKHPDVHQWMNKFKLTEDQYAKLTLLYVEMKDPVASAKKWLETPENRQAADSWISD